jgi:protease II
LIYQIVKPYVLFQVPFLDVLNTLLHPILPLTPIDYQEFGYPVLLEDFMAIKKYSPYENIQKDVLYPAVMITSSLSTRYY